ncbi:aminoglycoside 6-adenylyltransferase [Brasilonema sp. CT11]|nr:aminoglycoside 6-adenylyltransferase [Brasilonema sp. CT11]
MTKASEIFNRIIQWAEGEESIRAIILVGSRAQNEPVDELADFDVAVFATSYQSYLQDDKWLFHFGQLWVYIPEQYEIAEDNEIAEDIVPTRLAIYEGGVKVDFAFHTVSLLSKLEWDTQSRIVLDKDGITANLKCSEQKAQQPITEQEFINLVNEFWFEAYHVAKYLKREELWLVKFRDWSTKELLLQIIEWHKQAHYGWNYNTHYMGKHLKKWVDTNIWKALHQTFAHFDYADSRDALYGTMQLFRQLAQETAEQLGFTYPANVDESISEFIEQVVPPNNPVAPN